MSRRQRRDKSTRYCYLVVFQKAEYSRYFNTMLLTESGRTSINVANDGSLAELKSYSSAKSFFYESSLFVYRAIQFWFECWVYLTFEEVFVRNHPPFPWWTERARHRCAVHYRPKVWNLVISVSRKFFEIILSFV